MIGGPAAGVAGLAGVTGGLAADVAGLGLEGTDVGVLLVGWVLLFLVVIGVGRFLRMNTRRDDARHGRMPW
jgi:hypothetical protein